MQHPFTALEAEYASLLVTMQLTRSAEIDAMARRLIGYIDAGHYKDGCEATGVPQKDAAASFEREASSDFRLGPAQGDPIDRASTHVPKGIGPFATWTAAQEKAYAIDGLDKIGLPNWTWQRSCYEWELFNGFGYRAHGVNSPYLWAGTNHYARGKYVADGAWSSTEIDSQLGVIPVMFRITELRPDLAVPVGFPVPPGTVAPVITPAAAPVGLHDAATLQEALNALGADPKLVVDGSYGRVTRRAVEAFQQAHGLTVDGLAGPQTWDAIGKALEGLKS